MIAEFLRKVVSKLANVERATERPLQRDMTAEDEKHLLENLDFSSMAASKNIELMSQFTQRSREEFSFKTRSMVLYLEEEVHRIRSLEEKAALRAAPPGYELRHLNGINVGCGDRRIDPTLMPVDIMREPQSGSAATGEHHAFLPDAVLANPEDLPFKSCSLDYIVALHMLEHVSNPAEILRYWGTLLKAGGGIGLILPDYRYTWDARGDSSTYGHKWNTSEETFKRLYDRELREHFELEAISTIDYKISFDVILRKRGQFSKFSISNATSLYSGADLARMGTMAELG